MKKNFLVSAATCIAVLAILNSGIAQTSVPDLVYNNKDVPPSSPSSPSSKSEINATSETAVNAKAVKDFKKSYTGASNEKWFIVPGGFTTKFEQNGMEFRVDYDKKGKWSGTMKSYDEKKLARDVRHIVKSAYYDYSIKWVSEITVPEYPEIILYLIHIEDEKSFKNLQVIDGQIRVLEAYNKS